ncbi:hypothetical protein [Sphingopyxis witflariensis]|uniref:Uncharacterized protein n=1 Tax=Sphingopyxis witflariensis TaxID=173675 RepID=A0A246K7C8_9SPHN|nr:hypothetical protein [Sphingopyxis witflariensis]OWR01244.1 hypothetical protein CDQ91_02190 [Sphingopyxis witflariensis]
MRVAGFFLFLSVALGYAAWRGGGPERAMAGIATVMVISDPILHRFVPPGYASIDFGHLVIDGFGAVSTLTLALVAYRFWPMIAAALHILPMMAHASRASDLLMHPAAYMIMQVAWSWLVPPVLILATWRHQRRLRQNGNDPSWRNASPRLPSSDANI